MKARVIRRIQGRHSLAVHGGTAGGSSPSQAGESPAPGRDPLSFRSTHLILTSARISGCSSGICGRMHPPIASVTSKGWCNFPSSKCLR